MYTIHGKIDELVHYFLHSHKNQKIHFIPEFAHKSAH